MFEDCSCCFPVLEDHIHFRSISPKRMQASKMNISDLNVDIIPTPSNRSSGEFSFGDSSGSYGFIVPDETHISYHICWNVDLCLSISTVFNLCRLHVLLHGFLSNRNDKHTSHEARPSPRPDLRPGRQVLDLSHVKTQRSSGGVTEEVENWRVGSGGEEEVVSQCVFRKDCSDRLECFNLDVYFCILHPILVISGSKFWIFWAKMFRVHNPDFMVCVWSSSKHSGWYTVFEPGEALWDLGSR